METNNHKSLLASKTFWGSSAVMLSTILSMSGIPIGIDDINEVMNLSLQLIGIVTTIYGRVVAKEKITKVI